MYEPREELKNRIYYAAKDGMSLALFTLTNQGKKSEIDEIINEVCIQLSNDFSLFIFGDDKELTNLCQLSWKFV